MNKVIIITGGAGGMGLASAKLAVDEGYHVIISDINQSGLDDVKREFKDDIGKITTFRCDITDDDSVTELFKIANSKGSVIGVIHAAGVSPQMGDAERIIKINALGTINITEASLGIANVNFSLVNVASVAGHMSPKILWPRKIFKLSTANKIKFTNKLIKKANFNPKKLRSGQAYSLSKSFVIWYSTIMSKKFGQKNARVVSVSPGTFDTAMGRLEEKSGSDKLIQFAALKRYGRPEEIAELLVFLATGKASYITGTDILIDGGTKSGLSIKGFVKLLRSSL